MFGALILRKKESRIGFWENWFPTENFWMGKIDLLNILNLKSLSIFFNNLNHVKGIK